MVGGFLGSGKTTAIQQACTALLRKGPFLLQPHLELAELLAQAFVLLTHLLEREVAFPPAPGSVDDRPRTPLNLGEDTEGDRLQHRDPALGVHLRRDQDDVGDDHRQKEIAGALPNVQDSHGILEIYESTN